MVSSGSLPPVFYEHPVVQGAPDDVVCVPTSIYVDGVPFTRADSSITFYMTNVVTNTTTLLAAVRKADACSCGCNGWCTLFGIHHVLGWSLESGAIGSMPDARHDGRSWLPSDGERQCRAGERLGFRLVPIFLKCDLMEVSSTLGLPGVGHASQGCPLCFCSSDNKGNIAGLSPITLPWRKKHTTTIWRHVISASLKLRLQTFTSRTSVRGSSTIAEKKVPTDVP